MIKISIRFRKEEIQTFLEEERIRFNSFLDHFKEEGGNRTLRVIQENCPVKSGELLASLGLIPTEKGFNIEMNDKGFYVENKTKFLRRSMTELTVLLEDLANRIAEEVWSV